MLQTLRSLPSALVAWLRPYFRAYKFAPEREAAMSIGSACGLVHRTRVIRAAIGFYHAELGSAQRIREHSHERPKDGWRVAQVEKTVRINFR